MMLFLNIKRTVFKAKKQAGNGQTLDLLLVRFIVDVFLSLVLSFIISIRA